MEDCITFRVIIILAYLATIFTDVNCQEVEANLHFYTLYPCSDTNLKSLLSGEKAVQNYLSRTIVECAVSCTSMDDCNYAIFNDVSESCDHVWEEEGSSLQELLPAYLSKEEEEEEEEDTDAEKEDKRHHQQQQQQCFILRKKTTCLNGGTAAVTDATTTCRCPSDFTGPACEQPTPENCRYDQWRQLAKGDNVEYRTLEESMHQIKVSAKTKKNGHQILYTALFYRTYNDVDPSNRFVTQTHNFLAMNVEKETFETPLEREFQFYSKVEDELTTVLVTMEGQAQWSSVRSPDFSFMVNDRELFQKDQAIPLVSGLSKGYRLLSRQFSRVGFETDTKHVFTEVLYDSGTKEDQLFNPIYYFSHKDVLKPQQQFVIRTAIGTASFLTKTISPSLVRNWNLDPCWYGLAPFLVYDEFTRVLRDAVLRGRDVRLVLDGAVSSDVSMVTLTNTDVIATLADYLTPFDATTPLDETSRLVFSHVSRSGVLAECEMKFQGNRVYSKKAGLAYNSTTSLRWFVSSRPWTKVFVVTSGGVATFGKSENVRAAAMTGSGVRICVERLLSAAAANDLLTVTFCSGSGVVSVGPDGHVMVQTPGSLTNAFQEDGTTFARILGSECEQTVYLVSTKGWVKTATYRLGKVTDGGQQESTGSLEFVSITWFVIISGEEDYDDGDVP